MQKLYLLASNNQPGSDGTRTRACLSSTKVNVHGFTNSWATYLFIASLRHGYCDHGLRVRPDDCLGLSTKYRFKHGLYLLLDFIVHDSTIDGFYHHLLL